MNYTMSMFSSKEELEKARANEAVQILIDNGISEDDAWVIAEAIWDAYRSDAFPIT